MSRQGEWLSSNFEATISTHYGSRTRMYEDSEFFLVNRMSFLIAFCGL